MPIVTNVFREIVVLHNRYKVFREIVVLHNRNTYKENWKILPIPKELHSLEAEAQSECLYIKVKGHSCLTKIKGQWVAFKERDPE